MKKLLTILFLIPVVCIAQYGGGRGPIIGPSVGNSGGSSISTNQVVLQNGVATNITLMLPDGTITNLSDIPFLMPWTFQYALKTLYYGSPTTTYLATNGNDATAVVGNPALPFYSFTNAWSNAVPGGCIWIGPGLFTLPFTNNYIGTAQSFGLTNKSMVVVAQPNTYMGNGIAGSDNTLYFSNSLSIYGGVWDCVWDDNVGSPLQLMYVTMYPDYQICSNIDVIYPSSPVAPQEDIEWCKLFSIYDVNNDNDGGTNHFLHDWLIADATRGTPDGALARGYIQKAPSGKTSLGYLEDCLIISVGCVTGGSVSTNVGVAVNTQGSGVSTVVLNHDTFITGATNFDVGASYQTLSANSSVLPIDENYLSNIKANAPFGTIYPNMTMGQVLIQPATQTYSGSGAGLTNISSTGLNTNGAAGAFLSISGWATPSGGSGPFAATNTGVVFSFVNQTSVVAQPYIDGVLTLSNLNGLAISPSNTPTASFTFGARPYTFSTLAVATIRAATSTSASIVDIMPNGSPSGTPAWMDICDVDCYNTNPNPLPTIHFDGAGNVNDIDSVSYNGGTPLDLQFGVGSTPPCPASFYLQGSTGRLILNSNLVIQTTAALIVKSNMQANAIIVTNGITDLSSNALAPTAVSFPASGATWTNTFNKNIQVYINNPAVTGTGFSKNGTTIFTSVTGDITINLQPGEWFSETYTVGTPTATWSPL